MGKFLPSPDPGDGTLLPSHYSYLDRVCSSYQLQKERRKKPNNYHIPRSVARASKDGDEAWGTSEVWSNFQTKAAERSRGQVPRSEVLMGIAPSPVLNG